MAKAKPTANLTSSQKWRKFYRLVLLLATKKYGGRILAQLFFAFLVSAAIRAMDDIWTEFAEFKECQEDFLEDVTSNASSSYKDAADAMAQSVVGKSKCLLGKFDLCAGASTAARGVVDVAGDLLGRRRQLLQCTPKGLVKDVFGWTAPGKLNIPGVNMTIVSNTDSVLEKIEDDISKMKEIAKWTQYAGLIMAGLSILYIIFTAMRYTMGNKVWKPSRTSHAMRAISLLRVLGTYFLASLVIFLQAYSTDKFCDVRIDYVTMDLPNCELTRGCEFKCPVMERRFNNPCDKCNIKLHWWWVDVFSIPNILLFLYIAFMVVVVILECRESRHEKKELELDDPAAAAGMKKRPQKRKPQKETLVDSHFRDSAKGDVELADADGQGSPNVLDGPASSYMHTKEPEPQSVPVSSKSKYESSMYFYPAMGSNKGGFY